MFERRNHEKNKIKLIRNLDKKVQILKELDKGCSDDNMKQYYRAYIRAYNDCIQMIAEDKYY